MSTDREIWDRTLTVDQRFILARLVTSPKAEQWGGDLEVLRALVTMGLVDKTDDTHVLTDRGREIYQAGQPCQIAGPYHPRGDIDWVCRTHGDVVCELNPCERDTDGDGNCAACFKDGGCTAPVERSRMRCPIANPRPGDLPLAFENRSPGGAR